MDAISFLKSISDVARAYAAFTMHTTVVMNGTLHHKCDERYACFSMKTYVGDAVKAFRMRVLIVSF